MQHSPGQTMKQDSVNWKGLKSYNIVKSHEMKLEINIRRKFENSEIKQQTPKLPCIKQEIHTKIPWDE